MKINDLGNVFAKFLYDDDDVSRTLKYFRLMSPIKLSISILNVSSDL